MQTGHRVLLFSQMVKALDIVQDFLEDSSYSFLRLDGKTKVRARLDLQISLCLVLTSGIDHGSVYQHNNTAVVLADNGVVRTMRRMETVALLEIIN